jgi:predicted transcriptional regulator
LEDVLEEEKSRGDLFGPRTDLASRHQPRRSLLQVRMEILRVVMTGFGKPTQIMYKSNISWVVLQSQLNAFVAGGLLTVVTYGSRRRYAITEKGIDMVKSYEKVAGEILGGPQEQNR